MSVEKSYADPLVITLTYTAQAFGAATVTKKYTGPLGMKARLIDVSVLPTTTFAGTTPANITIGVSGTLNSLMTALSMGTTAAGTAIAKSAIRSAMVTTQTSGAIPTAAADTEILITMNTAVGGSPAGAADVTVTLGFY